MSLFSSPFSADYWRAARRELTQLRGIVFCALMVAAAIALGFFSIPVAENLKVSVSFVARALAAAVGGPLLGIVYGVVEDIVGWVIHPGGPFFPGYTLNTVLAVVIYALFFYRQRITVWRIVAAKVLTNYPINVGLGCLWSHMLYGKGYLYYAATSVVKNTLYLPIQILLLFLVLQSLIPVMRRTGLVSPEQPDYIAFW